MRASKQAGVLAAIVALVVAIAPGAAIAQQSSADGYGGEGGQIQSALGGDGNGDGNGPASAASGGTGEVDDGALPFTGLDLVLVLAGGLALVAAGVTIATLTPRGHRL